MTGVFFLLFLIAMMLVVSWSVKMERRPPGAPTSGLLAMREPKRPGDPKSSPPERSPRR